MQELSSFFLCVLVERKNAPFFFCRVAQMVKNLPAMWETWVRSLGRKIPWRREWLPTPVFLPGNSMDKGAWQATVHGVAKSRTRLSDCPSLMRSNAL